MKKKKLKSELFKKTILYTTLSVICISIISALLYYNSTKSMFLQQNEKLLSIMSEQTSHFLMHPIEEMVLIESELSKGLNREITQNNIELIINRFNYIDRIDYLDSQGIVTSSYPQCDDLLGMDLSSSPVYSMAQYIKPYDIVQGGVYVDPVLEEAKMPITMKTRDRNYIVGYVNLSKLKSAFNSAKLDNYFIAIVDNTGHYLLSSDDKAVIERQLNPNYKDIKNGLISSGDIVKFEGDSKILQFQSFEYNDWYILIYQDLDIMTRPISITLSIIISAFLLITILDTLAMGGLLSNINQSLIHFIEATKRVSRGKYQTYVESLDYIEFQNLAENFNTMIDEVQIREEEISTLNAQLEDSYLKTVYLLAKAIEAKDSYTGDHCERVMTYATLIGEKVGLSDRELYELKHGSLLHDIGKLNIPEGVLSKLDKLSDEEFDLIKTHTTYGYKIVSEMPNLTLAKEIVLYHHERIDGTGYPNGLKGDDIPLLARIVCIADSFDAIVSHRPYRTKKHTFEDSINELKRCSGSQFDSNLVNIFIKILRENPNIVHNSL